jgi:hypothetical protein
MGNVSRDSRLTFIMLWTLADDSGRLRGSSRMLASLLFPYDDDAPKKIDGWLTELERELCIDRYSVDGSHYVQIHNWLSHQKIDHPTASKIPPKTDTSETLANPRETSCEDQGLDRIKERIGKDQGKDASRKVAAEYSDEFEVWWSVYPQKKSKADAFKAWPKAVAVVMQVRDCAKPLAEQWLVEITRVYADSDDGRGEYVPNGATWLNGKRWEDDPKSWEKRNGTSKGSDLFRGVNEFLAESERRLI